MSDESVAKRAGASGLVKRQRGHEGCVACHLHTHSTSSPFSLSSSCSRFPLLNLKQRQRGNQCVQITVITRVIEGDRHEGRALIESPLPVCLCVCALGARMPVYMCVCDCIRKRSCHATCLSLRAFLPSLVSPSVFLMPMPTLKAESPPPPLLLLPVHCLTSTSLPSPASEQGTDSSVDCMEMRDAFEGE